MRRTRRRGSRRPTAALRSAIPDAGRGTDDDRRSREEQKTTTSRARLEVLRQTGCPICGINLEPAAHPAGGCERGQKTTSGSNVPSERARRRRQSHAAVRLRAPNPKRRTKGNGMAFRPRGASDGGLLPCLSYCRLPRPHHLGAVRIFGGRGGKPDFETWIHLAGPARHCWARRGSPWRRRAALRLWRVRTLAALNGCAAMASCHGSSCSPLGGIPIHPAPSPGFNKQLCGETPSPLESASSPPQLTDPVW